MEILFERCAGLDAHKRTVVACRVRQGEQETRTFGTLTRDLLQLLDWLQAWQCTHVAMESTGEYWKPIYNILEGNLEVWLVNARHVKAVPGRKTDVKDAEWLAELLQHGLLRASFIPPRDQRDLRDLTRQRDNLVGERTMVVNQLQRVLETANLKLASVATDVTGVSARAMLEQIVAGQADPAVMAALARGRMRSKQEELKQALTGRVREHHRFLTVCVNTFATTFRMNLDLLYEFAHAPLGFSISHGLDQSRDAGALHADEDIGVAPLRDPTHVT